jgi:hypothetical protein
MIQKSLSIIGLCLDYSIDMIAKEMKASRVRKMVRSIRAGALLIGCSTAVPTFLASGASLA